MMTLTPSLASQCVYVVGYPAVPPASQPEATASSEATSFTCFSSPSLLGSMLFSFLWGPGGGTCSGEPRLRLQLCPLLGLVTLADDQASLVSLPHMD